MSEGIADLKGKVASLISGFCDSLERDGYELDWTVDEKTGILDASVTAGQNACGECLVPKQVMLFMLESVLKGSGVRLGQLNLPKELSQG